MRIVRLVVEVSVPTDADDDQILGSIEQACQNADNCIEAEVVSMKRIEEGV